MRSSKQNNFSKIRPGTRFVYIAILAVMLPLVVNLLRSNSIAIGSATQDAALLSAFITMPDTGLMLFQERLEAELQENQPGEISPAAEITFPPSDSGIPLDSPGDATLSDWVDEPFGEADTSIIETPDSTTPKAIPARYSAPLIGEDCSGRSGGNFLQHGAGLIRNDTKLDNEDILEILETSMDIPFENSTEPQVLIVHTHATESFEKYDNNVYDTRNTWRTTDNNYNMVAVGNVMTDILNDNGISVLHDTTQHDYPSYNGSYERAAKTINKYLQEYPSIKVVLDLHRDAMQRDDAIIKPVATINGKKAAQIMIICSSDDGTMDVPNWRENLRFAAAFQDKMNRMYPGLTRPVFLCYRKYNMDLTNGSLLLEFGSNANTLEEAIYSAQLSAQALADLINSEIQ